MTSKLLMIEIVSSKIHFIERGQTRLSGKSQSKAPVNQRHSYLLKRFPLFSILCAGYIVSTMFAALEISIYLVSRNSELCYSFCVLTFYFTCIVEMEAVIMVLGLHVVFTVYGFVLSLINAVWYHIKEL